MVSLHVYAERLVIVAEANKEPVLNCLSRLNDTPRPKPVNPPPPLRLVTEPVADSRRYDRLREGKR